MQVFEDVADDCLLRYNGPGRLKSKVDEDETTGKQ